LIVDKGNQYNYKDYKILELLILSWIWHMWEIY